MNCYAEGGQTLRAPLPTGIVLPLEPTSRFGTATTIIGGTYPDSVTKSDATPPNTLIAVGITGGQQFIYPEGQRSNIIELRRTGALPGTVVGSRAFAITENGAAIIGCSLATEVVIYPTSNRRLNEVDSVVLVTASNINVNLPDATTCKGRVYTIKRVDNTTGTTVVVRPDSGLSAQTIDGQPTYVLTAVASGPYKYVSVVSTGAVWAIIANN